MAADANALVAITLDAAAIAYAACVAAVDALAAPYFDEVQALEVLINDPPDPNFTVIATPVVPSLPSQPFTTATGFGSQVTIDLNSLLSNLEQQIALLRVIPTTINRVSGAVEAGDAFWQTQQARAVQNYSSQLIPLLQNESSLRAALTNDFKADGVVFTFSSNDVLNATNQIRQNGLPAGVSTDLTQLGLDAVGQSAVLETILSTDPILVAALGTGAFPEALSDPLFKAANNNAINAFAEFVAAPPVAGIT